MISLAKFTIAMQYADIMNIPFMLYVEWTNPLEREYYNVLITY